MTNYPITNAFTVDLEEWFQGLTSTNPLVAKWPHLESRVVAATETLLRILREHHVQATFFALGAIADQHPALIERICADGHEIGVHGYYHRFVSRLTPAEFATELRRTLDVLLPITGQRPLGHRAPYFSINSSTPWAFDVLRDHGFRYDSSIFPARSLLYGSPHAPRFPHFLPDTGLMEFPVSTMHWAGVNWPMAGGFYGRLLPYPLIRRAVRRLNAQGQPAILYIHPWELDTEQQYDEVTLRERISHYYGRRTVAAKLHDLFSDFPFTTLGALLAQQETAAEATLTSVEAAP